MAKEGVSLAVASNSAASECINLLGGLSIDQVRWMYSSFPNSGLDHSGWDAASVPFSDGDDDTRLWSELHENCTATEILVAGPPPESGAAAFLTKTVLLGQKEAIRPYYTSTDTKELDAYLMEHQGAISFFQMQDLLTREHVDRIRTIHPVPIMDKHGHFIEANSREFEHANYPLLRNVFLGIHINDPFSMQVIRPFLEFGFSDKGSQVLVNYGFWPLPEWEKLSMYTRIGSELGVDVEDLKEQCGPAGVEIYMAGSSNVEPVADIWSGLYSIGCDVEINQNGGGSSAGANRVCGNSKAGGPVDIGNMSRIWKDSEASQRAETFVHDCLIGDVDRSSVQIDVAMDGISVVLPKNGPGYSCINMLGGLTRDQLRWIYSNYDEAELVRTGWDRSSLKNSDHNPDTHLWSELDARCDPEEIVLSGDRVGEGTFGEFTQFVLSDLANGESIDLDRPNGYAFGLGYELLFEVLNDANAISFVGYHYYFEKMDLVWAAPLQTADGTFVAPSEEAISDGSYPLIRSLFMNVLNNEESLQHTTPLLQFGLDHPEAIRSMGYIPLRGAILEEMVRRLDQAPYDKGDTSWDDEYDNDGFDFTSWQVVLGTIIGLAILLCIVMYGCYARFMKTV